jgi:hypothetical protein
VLEISNEGLRILTSFLGLQVKEKNGKIYLIQEAYLCYLISMYPNPTGKECPMNPGFDPYEFDESTPTCDEGVKV